MSVLRKNTLVVDFSVLPKRPDADKVEKFLEKKVKLKLADTKNIQFHNIRNRVYIETVDSETALRYEQANANKHIIVCNNKEFKIPVYVESEAVTVRVHDLPSHTSHHTVIDFMQQYGIVISITRERWRQHFPGIYNGVRVLRMKLNRPIPSVVTIDGEPTLVTYPNQPKTCNRCGGAVHPKKQCAKSPRTEKNDNTPQAPQLDEDQFPPLSIAPAQQKSNSIPNEEVEERDLQSETILELTKRNENNKGKNITSDGGDDCEDNDDDDDDGDDGDRGDGGDDGEGGGSSNLNDFVEAINTKRRMSRKVLSPIGSDSKKICLNKGNQEFGRSSNRFQALVEIDPVNASATEIENCLNRSQTITKNQNCNSSL